MSQLVDRVYGNYNSHCLLEEGRYGYWWGWGGQGVWQETAAGAQEVLKPLLKPLKKFSPHHMTESSSRVRQTSVTLKQ